jgi:hypothetical protein
MKQILKTLLFTATFAVALWSCEKVAPLTVYEPGKSVLLQSSVTTIATKTADSLSTAVLFTWTNPGYATNQNTVKYVLQIDSSGRGFSKATSLVLNGRMNYAFTGKELNAVLLGFGFSYNVAYKIDARVISSYGNNNEQLTSNVLTLTATPYVIPPKVQPPTSNKLFLVGSATVGGWSNPVPLPTQEFKRLDSVTYEGTFYLKGGQQYLALPVNGDWGSKYSVANNSVTDLNLGGDFGFNFNDNFPGPSKTGMYKIRLDFQRGKFTVTAVPFGMLFVAGDYQGWAPDKASSLGSIKNDEDFHGFIDFGTSGALFKFTSQPDWNGNNYGGTATTISTSGANLSVSSGYYLVRANTKNATWSNYRVTSVGIVGQFTGWSANPDVALTYDSGNKVWKTTFTLGSDTELKFRFNSAWDVDLGDTGADGILEFGGGNIAIKAGTYDVVLNLSNGGYYTYSFTKK